MFQISIKKTIKTQWFVLALSFFQKNICHFQKNVINNIDVSGTSLYQISVWVYLVFWQDE